MNIRSGLALLVCVFTAQAADLKRETLTAWQLYVRAATVEMQARVKPDRHFLTLDEDQEAMSDVRHGQIVVLHNGSKGVKKVPSGLIHDWSGAAFIASATLNDVFSVARDYDHYKDFYRPNVVDSKAISSGQAETRFSMTLMNKGLVSAAMDGEYRCSFFRVDEHRWYSISETTRMREVESYGTPDQRELSDGQGKGLIWRLFSIARFEERDGGVYVELEAIALTRDIPVSVRWLIEPIVSRVSRSSLTTSLRQTENAVQARATLLSESIQSARRGAR
ncbi:MAG: hypothetical protein JO270_05445 [Acidobacteriaceae bacterium]|nr:hypothetical protein [Acidobacteriaceae bacterium]MBV8572068.1 hypothetical protein [Acidobacteriaceae bacterium]